MAHRQFVLQHVEVQPATPLPSEPTIAGRWRPPAGRELLAPEFAWRHRFVCVVVALHLPLLAVLAFVRGGGAGEVLLAVAPVAALLGLAVLRTRRRLQAAAATGALLACSAVLVHVFDGDPQLLAHAFVAVAAIALYQDWPVYAVAVCLVALLQGLSGLTTGWTWALVQAAFVLAAAAVLVVFWKADEKVRAEQEDMQEALVSGQTSVQVRMAETDRIRADLIGTVSHEFRTPLTGIRGAALTLLKRGERLDATGRATLLQAVLEQEERLSRLLENMLIAAQATAPDPAAAAEVDAVAAEVAMLAGAARPAHAKVSLLVEPGTTARIDRQAMHQVLANLVDNAQQHGAPGAVPLVAGGLDEAGVWITVSNEGTTLDSETARRLFEPFTQADSGPTRPREGLGMGLYVVRRLVEVHGGSVQLRSEGGWTTVELRLQSVGAADRASGRVAV